MITSRNNPVYVNRVQEPWQQGGGVSSSSAGNDPFAQLDPTLDLVFAGVPNNLGKSGPSLDLYLYPQQYQIAAQYSIWENGAGLVPKNFGDIITFTRASSATYFDSAGVLQTATTDVPRFDYDPSTLAAQGLLIEEARTNLLLYSTEFDNAWWTANGTTVVTPNAGVAPDGTTTAELVTDATGTLTNSLQRSTNIAISNATAYTLTAYIKLGTATDVGIRVRCPGGSASDIGYFAGGQDVGNGWRRVTANITSDTTGALVYFGLADGTFYIWGAQLEAGAFPTSYIPTTSASVTRAADVASVNTLSPWYNAAEGTLYGEANTAAPNGSGVQRRIANISNVANTDAINVGYAGATAVSCASVIVGSSAQASFTAPLGGFSLPTKVAIAYAENDFQAAANGYAFSPDTSGTLPTVTQMNLGGTVVPANTRTLNGHITRIVYYPRRLSNTELQAITA